MISSWVTSWITYDSFSAKITSKSDATVKQLTVAISIGIALRSSSIDYTCNGLWIE